MLPMLRVAVWLLLALVAVPSYAVPRSASEEDEGEDDTYSYSEAPEPPPPSSPPPPPPRPPPPPVQITLCSDACPKSPKFASDNYCDDGGPDAAFDNCELGTDCADCGPRVRMAHVPAAPQCR